MDKHINLEAFDFAIRKLQIDLMLNGKSEYLINKYSKIKSSYKKLRNINEYDKDECLTALYLFKEHLENQSNLYDIEIKDLIMEKIDRIDYQINRLN